jgi:hypothetical protein
MLTPRLYAGRRTVVDQTEVNPPLHRLARIHSFILLRRGDRAPNLRDSTLSIAVTRQSDWNSLNP